MYKLFILLISFLGFLNLDLESNANPFVLKHSTSSFFDKSHDEQIQVRSFRPGIFSYKCECEIIVVIQRFWDQRANKPAVRQWYKKFGGSFHELKLDEGAALDPSLIFTCDQICSGAAPEFN